MSTQATFAPRPLRSTDVALPIPAAAPVTRKRLPVRSIGFNTAEVIRKRPRSFRALLCDEITEALRRVDAPKVRTRQVDAVLKADHGDQRQPRERVPLRKAVKHIGALNLIPLENVR